MNLEPINSGSVVNEILQRITRSIINEEIKAGDKLPTEVELMEQLGVGRNSIREAIKMLSAMGVLEIRRGQGTFVAKKVSPTYFNPLVFSLILEPKSNQDLYELRVMFDSMVLFLVIDKATQDDIERVKSIVDQTKEQYENGSADTDLAYFVDADIRFHLELLKATHNPLVEKIGRTIIELFPKYVKRSIQQRGGTARSIENHYKIIDVIKSKDKASVMEIIEKTLREWKNNWED